MKLLLILTFSKILALLLFLVGSISLFVYGDSFTYLTSCSIAASLMGAKTVSVAFGNKEKSANE